MVTITVQYEGQLRRAAGVGSETIAIATANQMVDLIRIIANKRSETLKPMLLDPHGEPRPSILLFLGDRQVRLEDSAKELTEGVELTLLAPISGGWC